METARPCTRPTGTFVVQGWKVDDAEALAEMKIPAYETAVEIPLQLLRFAPTAN